MENTPLPTPDLKAERRYSSNIGIGLFIYALLSLGLQFLGQTLLTRFAPELADEPIIFFAALLLPTYIIATPICGLALRFSPPEKIEKKKLRVSHFFIAMLMCFTLMYSGNLLGTLIGTVADRLCGSNSGIADLLVNSSPLANLIFVVILAPIFEELIFRKLLVDRFIRYGEKTAVLCSGLLFGLFHGNFYQFFYAAMLGMLFAYIYAKTGRVRITVLLHMLVNFFGGFVGPLVLELTEKDYEGILLAAAELIETSDAGIEAAPEAFEMILPLIPGLLAISAYEILFMGAVVAGLVMLIVFRRRFKFSPGRVDLGSSAFSVTWVNFGIILFSVTCAFLFALNLAA